MKELNSDNDDFNKNSDAIKEAIDCLAKEGEKKESSSTSTGSTSSKPAGSIDVNGKKLTKSEAAKCGKIDLENNEFEGQSFTAKCKMCKEGCTTCKTGEKMNTETSQCLSKCPVTSDEASGTCTKKTKGGVIVA